MVIAEGWSEEKKRAARIRDNSISLLSSWDAGLLKSEWGALKLRGFDMPLLGFAETELRGWGLSIGTESAVDPEVVPEPPKKPVVRRGDLWLLGPHHRLLCGDATSEFDVAMCLGVAKPAVVVTDSPYGVDYDANWRNEAAAKG